MKKLLIALVIISLLLFGRAVAQQQTLESLIRWEGNKGILTKSVKVNISGFGTITFSKGMELLTVEE